MSWKTARRSFYYANAEEPEDIRLTPETTALLVEGYLDVIALHEAGLCNTVATCGTAMTIDQARILKRTAGNGAQT